MKSKIARIGAVIGGLCAAVFLISPYNAASLAGEGLMTFLDIMSGNAITKSSSIISILVMFVVYAAPAALCSGLAWLIPEKRENALKTACLFAAVPILLSLIMVPIYNIIGLLDSLATIIGAFGCIGCILLYGWLQKKMPSVFNRETISYIVFGVLTTVVSFVSQMLFSAAGFPVIVNTIGSWVCAVIFAYIVNKLFVFESKTDTAKAFWRELGLFIGARVASLGMELVFMFVTVELLNFSEAVCKLVAQVFILVANYVFSKLFIFKK